MYGHVKVCQVLSFNLLDETHEIVFDFFCGGGLQYCRIKVVVNLVFGCYCLSLF